ncbi:MAG TPA: ATP/GTP-binding protein [Candidatus Nanopelagicaceae bacterium]|nr:ATP/GTP-binding protein [Candidatus Nanopelagicaceae bacterium]
MGTAGSGKSSLTGLLRDYVTKRDPEISAITLNLDPGVKFMPYTPDIDIRDFLVLEEVMTEYGLGPNGAMILASDLMVNFLDDLKYEIDEYNADWVFVDTAGQLELFAFRETGPLIASSLGFGSIQRAVSFLFDSNLVLRPNGFISTLLLAASVQFRFRNIPQINVLSKADLLSEDQIEMVVNWSQDFKALEDSTNERESGLIRELSMLISEVFSQLGSTSELISCSIKEDQGLDYLFAYLQRIFDSDKSKFY